MPVSARTRSDMSVCLWDTVAESSLVHRYEQHTEFVLGVDFNMFAENQLASCAWDEHVCVWRVGEEPRIAAVA